MKDPDPVKIGPDPQHCFKHMVRFNVVTLFFGSGDVHGPRTFTCVQSTRRVLSQYSHPIFIKFGVVSGLKHISST